ncbi:MAG: amidinotransferase [Chitinophagales bacterium]|nr:amidinotransferase [Chitinophagales bacterium]
MERQLTNHILMVRPANFGYNEETAVNNAFQSDEIISDAEALKRTAISEFDNMVAALRTKGIDVTVVQDSETPIKPDAVFPNNWISFHGNGSIITYPMFAKNRRIERREEIIEQIEIKFDVKNRYGFEFYEDESEPIFLEGTGSMIFDRPNKLVYACVSKRTSPILLDKFNVLMDMKSCLFRAVGRDGQEIYHTNVMMALGEDFVVICMESVADEASRKELLGHFARTGKEVVDITLEQMESFAGNMLEVKANDGQRYLCMSQSAYDSLNDDQKAQLESHTNLLPIPIPNIEKFGGGSVRCMMAEVFLPLKKQNK